MPDGQDDLLSPDDIESLIQAARQQVPQSGPAPAPSSELLDASDIEALMSGAMAPPPKKSAPSKPAPAQSDLLDASDIEALMAGAPPPKKPTAPKSAAKPAAAKAPSGPEQLLQSAQSQLAAAVAPSLPKQLPPGMAPTPFAYEDFSGHTKNTAEPSPLGLLEDVELDIRIELGRTELLIEDVLKLRDGSVVPLDKLAGDPVDILVNGRLIARGEVLVLNDSFCVRVAEIISPEN